MSDLKQRIYETAKDMQLINVATITEDGRPWVRYVMGKADKELVFRFCTFLESRKVHQLKKNPNIHISLGVQNLETASNWLQVAGSAEVTTDESERHSFWFEDLKNYFSGPDDPNYCIVIVRPSMIEFGTMGNPVPETWQPNS